MGIHCGLPSLLVKLNLFSVGLLAPFFFPVDFFLSWVDFSLGDFTFLNENFDIFRYSFNIKILMLC